MCPTITYESSYTHCKLTNKLSTFFIIYGIVYFVITTGIKKNSFAVVCPYVLKWKG